MTQPILQQFQISWVLSIANTFLKKDRAGHFVYNWYFWLLGTFRFKVKISHWKYIRVPVVKRENFKCMPNAQKSINHHEIWFSRIRMSSSINFHHQKWP